MSTDTPTPSGAIDELAKAAIRTFETASAIEADRAAEALLAASTDHPLGLLLKGVLLERAERYLGALDFLERAVLASPTYGSAYNSLGVVLFRLGRVEEAAQRFSRAMTLSPKDAQPRNNLGNIRRIEGRLGEARTLYEKAVSLDPRYIDALTNLAMIAAEEQRHEEAERLATRAVEVARVPSTLFALAKARIRRGDTEGARTVLQEVVALDPADRHGAGLRLAALGDAPTPDRAPAPYVRHLFDDMAAGYDRILTSGLHYTGPTVVAEALAALRPDGGLAILDLGCGTGLCGVTLKPLARRLDGVDLSPAMVRLAEKRRLYDTLTVADVVEHLAGAEGSYDAVVAGDVFCYLGALGPVLVAAHRALAQGGVLVFTVEAAVTPPPSGFASTLDGRYMHGMQYLEGALSAAGFPQAIVDGRSVRREGGSPVGGFLVTARKGGPS